MINFTVLREERRTISKGSCPVDLMGEIARYGKDIESCVPYCYKLTLAAFNAMCFFPVDKFTNWTFDSVDSNLACITIEWFPSGDTMDLFSTDDGTAFMVHHSNTEELVCDLEDGGEYILYTIDVE